MALPITPAGFQLTIFCQYHDQGFSNSIYSNAADYAAAKAILVDWWDALRKFMVEQCTYVWGRISKTDVRGDAVVVPATEISTPEGELALEGMEAADAILFRYNKDGIHWNCYTHGFPKAFLASDGTIDRVDADFVAATGNYNTFIGTGVLFLPTKYGAAAGTRVLVAPTSIQYVKLLTRKVGRPFGPSVGRRAA